MMLDESRNAKPTLANNSYALSHVVRSTRFSRQAMTPPKGPKGGTTNGSNNRLPYCIAIRACVVLFLFTFSISNLAADINLEASVNRDEIQIADPFELEIRLVAPTGTLVSFPAQPESLGPFEVLSTKDKFDVPFSNQNGNDRLWVRTVTLETLETGQLEIPITEVTVRQTGQSEKILRTQPIAINVESVIEPATDLTKFKDIAGVNDVKVLALKSYGWIWMISGAAVLAITGSALLIATRRKKTVSAKAWAVQKMQDARKVSEAETIVRQFISERFAVPANSLPTDQVLSELRSRSVDASTLHEVQELLQNSERTKFSGLNLAATEKARLINLAAQVVEKLDQVSEAN